jgi:S1-C subfamily serine protease
VRAYQQAPEPAPTRLEAFRKGLGRFYRRFSPILLIALSLLFTLGAVLIYDAVKRVPQPLTPEEIESTVEGVLEAAPPKPSNASVAYAVIGRSVVHVQAATSEDGSVAEGAFGSGVVIVDSGIILTNLHVVGDASVVQVEVVVRQPEKDLAVLRARVIPDDLIPATLASSAMLRIGDEVVAVGHPFGISNSVSAGVVSGKGRNYRWPETDQTLTNLIQFDAAVNPGNSGGPLVNRYGEVVGIVTALLNPTDQDVFIGIGFAVPIETAAAAAGPPLW